MKNKDEKNMSDNGMPSEYDFAGKKGVRGKYYKAYRQGHSVRIHDDDGAVSVRYFKPEEGSVMLDPDIRKYFPDSETVNNILRSLIALIPDSKAESFVNDHVSDVRKPNQSLHRCRSS